MLAKKTKEIVNLKKQLIGTCSCIIIVAVSLKTPNYPDCPQCSFVYSFRYFKVLVQELDVKMDKGWLLELIELFGSEGQTFDVSQNDWQVFDKTIDPLQETR